MRMPSWVKHDDNHAYLPVPGGYWLHASEHSQYQGLFKRRDNSLFKYVDELRFDTDVHHVSRGDSYVKLHGDDANILVDATKSGLRILVSDPVSVDILVDTRYIHDYDDRGRIYNVEDDELTTITYTKYESDQRGHEDYTASITVDASSWNTAGSWTYKDYAYDDRRGTKHEFWVYHAGRFTVEPGEPARIDCDAPIAHNENDALSQFEYIDDSEMRLAAGYPWFYQAWSRDEIISLDPMINDDPSRSKDILVGAAERDQGVKSVEGSDLASADTPGWAARRTKQVLRQDVTLSEKEKTILSDYFQRCVDRATWQDGLVVNDALETWMDTSGGTGDTRSGARVEIQAGMLGVLDLLHDLTGEKAYEERYNDLRGAVQNRLVKGGIVHDGFENGIVDWTPRPNVFLAYYVHKDMLPDSTWKTTFAHVLDHCWLDWGGLSSIGQDHELFFPHHTGVDNRSYHRGDSWYYVNNVAAIAMHDVAPNEFLRRIEHIRRASRRDYERLGAVGAASEISSASEQETYGCFSQAWSLATLVELQRRLR